MIHTLSETALARRLRDHRLFMYAVIGAVASAIDVGLFVLLYEWVGLPALVAHSISIPVSAACSFGANARYNFRTTDRLPMRAGSFAVVVALGYGLGALVIWLFASQTPFGATAGKLVSLPLVFLFQFSLNSRISFRQRHAA